MFKLIGLLFHYTCGVPCGFAARLLFPLLYPFAKRWGFIGPKSVAGKESQIPREAMLACGEIPDSWVWVAVHPDFAHRVFSASGWQLAPVDKVLEKFAPNDPDRRAVEAILAPARRAYPTLVFFIGNDPRSQS